MAKRKYTKEDIQLGGEKELEEVLQPKTTATSTSPVLTVPKETEDKTTVKDVSNSLEDHRGSSILDHLPGSVQLKHLEKRIRAVLENLLQVENQNVSEFKQNVHMQGNLGIDGLCSIGVDTFSERLHVELKDDSDKGLRVTDGTLNSNIVLQPLTGDNSGFQPINFNGYYDSGGQRFNPSKNRWRLLVDQRGTNDYLAIDRYDGDIHSLFKINENDKFMVGDFTPITWTVANETLHVVGATDNIHSSTGHYGFVAFRRSDGIRGAYVGYGNGGSYVHFHLENASYLLVDGGSLAIGSLSRRLEEGLSYSIRNRTAYGYVDIGPKNSSWCHFETDRANFWFNKSIHPNGHVQCYSANTYDVQKFRHIYAGNNSYYLSSDGRVKHYYGTSSGGGANGITKFNSNKRFEVYMAGWWHAVLYSGW